MTESEIHEQFVETYMHILKYIGDFVSVPTRPYKITFEAYIVMRMIATSEEPLTLVKIANRQRVSRSAIARQINVLLDLKYIDQTTNAHDRRIKYLSLTPTGSRVEQSITAASDERFHQWMQVYGEKRAGDTLRYITDAEKKATKLGFSGFSGLHDKRGRHAEYTDPKVNN
ncbi:MarR family winged helix-turn-helix transcriptional regulator [Lactiplantibacillus xiangfangensis]|jgi:DNA-binding MarR family transcriptional regulator|uniref:Transcription regulator n=1 Tax=Lactiplantibacillus xiangfangensis TaxID=942150 RepID=A0A0R2MAJ3_9LACO|nr:MarR family transcriptional regulator [Lactiplantibacillus xiangfangensis]KRO09056.1 transcription regulator [Lactiplantibacillus xiangfangensis]